MGRPVSMTSRALRTTAAAVVAAALIAGCVSQELAALDRAKLAYRQCLGLHSGHPERCEAEKARADQRYGEYEERAQRSWGCDHSGDECWQD